MDVPAGVTGSLLHLPSEALALNFFARRIQPFPSLVDREAVFNEEIFPRNFGVGGVKKFPRKKSSGAQSEDLGPSLTIQEFFSRKYSWFYMQRIS